MRTINKEIIALTVPAIVTNITTPLLGLVDTAITGHLGDGDAAGSASYIGAIAVGAGMFSLVYWPLNFLRMGTSGLTSQALGASMQGADRGECNRVLMRALSLAILISVALLPFSDLIGKGLLAFMDADSSTTGLAMLYFKILIFGMPAVLCTYAFTGWFLGMQDSKSPMYMALATNVSNIIVSLSLVFGLGMNINGVAIGTLSSQWIGLAVGAMIYARKYSAHSGWPTFHDLIKTGHLKRFFSINSDIFLRTLCLAAVTIWFTRTGARQGADVLAANALLMQLFILFSYFMDGFAFAGEALSGKYYGMKEYAMLKSTIKGLFAWGIAIVAVFTIVYLCCGTLILRLLTDDTEVAAMATKYLPWAAAVPVAGVAAFVWDGIFIGLTLTRQMLVSLAAAMCAFFLIYTTCMPPLGNHGLWLAFICYLSVRGIMQTAQYHFFERRLNSRMSLK